MESSRSWTSLARLEVATLALLPRSSGGETEGFVQLEPTLTLDGGSEFGLNLGAPVRLRAWDGAYGVRCEDRDNLSDWGQLVRGLKLLFPDVDGTLRPGAFASVGLGVDNAC